MADASTYNFDDIQRYLQHKMSAQEMHAFEKAMMDDPFLADAIEGYKTSNEAVVAKHLNEIEDQIKGNKQKAKVVAMPSKNNGWWKIAAIILLIVTGAAISYNLLNNSIADKNEVRQIAQQKSEDIRVANDSVGPAENATTSEKVLPDKELQAYKQSKDPFSGRKAQAPFSEARTDSKEQVSNSLRRGQIAQTERDSTIEAMRDHEEKAMLSAAAPSADQMEARLEATQSKRLSLNPANEFKGKVIDTGGRPLPSATVVILGTGRGTTTDSNGNFSLKVPDSVLNVSVSALGFAETRTKIKRSPQSNRITLEEPDEKLQEAVVTAAGVKAGPVGGWNNFYDYVKREVQHFKESTNNNYNGDITVEFSTNRNGRPRDITVKEKADKVVADKAIEILMNGPKWKRNKNVPTTRVIMDFRGR